jgi:predicted amidohydrolase YtcJ
MSDALLVHGIPVYVRHGLPPVEAIGIVDGRVAAVGATDQVRGALPPGTPERHLPHGALMPAFIDPHQHAFLVASDPGVDTLYRRSWDIRGLVDEIARQIADGDEGQGARTWLRLHGYEPLTLTERRSPTAAELDRAAGDRPLHVMSRTFHESAVSSAGLDALGIGTGTPDPPGGRIMRDRRGRPTGVLLEAASFVAEAASRSSDAGNSSSWRERLRAHGQRLLANGVTRIGDAAVPAEAARAFVEDLATIGVTAHPLLVGDRIDEPALVEGATAKVLLDGGEYCHLCMTGRQVRMLMGGSIRANLGPERGLARAVGLRAGFPRRETDRRWHTGIRFRHEAGFPALLRAAADAGSGLAVHAVGNGAVGAVLDALGADPGLADAVSLRVEHAMAIDVPQARALGRAGFPVVVQPGFIGTFGHELSLVPLPDPLRLMPFRTMHEAGVQLAFSSDYPAAGLSPWDAVRDAVTRLDSTGSVIEADESIDLRVALDLATRGAARALGVDEGGTLEPGRPADLIWCDRDPLSMPPASLGEISILVTWSRGPDAGASWCGGGAPGNGAPGGIRAHATNHRD